MFLTADELSELTGRKRWSAQIRWLKAKHWGFTTRADGRPIVSRAEAEQRRKQPARRCSVYIAVAEGVERVCKIGASVRVASRIKTLDASSPLTVALLYSREFADEPEAYEVEAALHRTFRKHRRAGTEWFHDVDVAAVRASLERARP